MKINDFWLLCTRGHHFLPNRGYIFCTRCEISIHSGYTLQYVHIKVCPYFSFHGHRNTPGHCVSIGHPCLIAPAVWSQQQRCWSVASTVANCLHPCRSPVVQEPFLFFSSLQRWSCRLRQCSGAKNAVAQSVLISTAYDTRNAEMIWKDRDIVIIKLNMT